ncbi:nuclear transport factor 2 family protein [Noviherbaspirillum sedimenti]|uniref:Nuclear transport factor 2 family protein n=2 Tax=Noviherbaspirillum sedimenti TaxID=2320865 RepID=A0A3A3FYW8_9BURK|nr:nuclear transport factor 2 family protein [Noviherbaspirillum sedimenti]
MNIADKLYAIEQIRLLKARYFRFVDTKQWDSLRAIFTDDATVFFAEAFDAPRPIDEGMTFIKDVLQTPVSIHSGFMPEIEIVDANHAKAIWAMTDQIYWLGSEGNPFGISQMTGAGHYHETYRRENDVWKIETLKLTRLRRLTIPLPSAN